MNLTEAIKNSDQRMLDDDAGEFAERALVEGEDIVAAFWLFEGGGERGSVVFTTQRLAIETERWMHYVGDKSRHVSSKLMSIPYRSITMHTVDLELGYDPSGMTGTLRLFVSGTSAESAKPWIHIQGDGVLDLRLLSRVLAEQIAKS